MKQSIAHISLLVKDYDEAIKFFTEILRFNLVEDTKIDKDKRWVRVAPPGTNTSELLLAKASNEKQKAAIGNQSGGRVFLFLYTDNFRRDYYEMRQNGVNFLEPPRNENYGTVAVFEDLYGNKWDLIEPHKDKSY